MPLYKATKLLTKEQTMVECWDLNDRPYFPIHVFTRSRELADWPHPASRRSSISPANRMLYPSELAKVADEFFQQNPDVRVVILHYSRQENGYQGPPEILFAI